MEANYFGARMSDFSVGTGKGLTTDQVFDMALELPETSDEVKWNDVTVCRNGRGMVWALPSTSKKLEGRKPRNPDGGFLVFHVSWEDHDRLLEQPGSIFFKKPHYENYPALLVDSSDLDEETAREMLRVAWQGSAEKVRYRSKPKF